MRVRTDVGWLYLVMGADVLQTSIAYSGTHYEREVVKLLKHRVGFGQSDIVLDVGGHAGYYSLLLSKCVGAGGRMVAFEPQPALAHQVRRSLAANGIAWGQVLECSVTNRSGNSTLFRTVDSGRSSLVPQSLESEAAVPTPSISLDDYVFGILGRGPTLIKMDIEGAEWLALQGMKRTLSQFHPKLVLELHPALIEALGGTQSRLVRALAESGYDLFHIDHRRGVLPLPQPLPTSSTWHLFAVPSEA